MNQKAISYINRRLMQDILKAMPDLVCVTRTVPVLQKIPAQQ